MRLGTMLSMPGDPSGTRAIVERAGAAEQAGFASCWLPQVGTVDALMVLALAGAQTRSIELGTAVVPTYPRHPTALAMQALTVQDATGNRLALGIGLSHRFMIEDSLGLDYSKPIPHMRDYLTILTGLLRGEPVKYAGQAYRVTAQVGVAGAKPPPILVAALGPDMLRLCGRLADGTITWMGGINYLRDVAIPTMSAAAREAGRPPPRFVAMVPVVHSPTTAAGRDAINAAFRMYGQIPSYRATLDRGGAAMPGDVAIVGSAAEIEAGVHAYADIGVTDLVAAVPTGDAAVTKTTMEILSALAKQGRRA
jgi:5,10-methylenetetrahydromethanopterin reductase